MGEVRADLVRSAGHQFGLDLAEVTAVRSRSLEDAQCAETGHDVAVVLPGLVMDIDTTPGRLLQKSVQFNAFDAVVTQDRLTERRIDDSLHERPVSLDDLAALHGLERFREGSRIAGEKQEAACVQVQTVAEGDPGIP